MIDLTSLHQLTKRLNSTATLSREQAHHLYRAKTDKIIARVLDGENFRTASPALSILNEHLNSDEAEFRSALRAIDNDLERQVEIVNESLDRWFESGEIAPPYYPWRIAVILSKAKLKDDERDFLNAWCRHFSEPIGGRFSDLLNRAAKLNAL